MEKQILLWNRIQGFMNFKGEILKNDFYRTLV